MVLVQEYEIHSENAIYYLSKGLARPELKYSPMEKLSLEVVFIVSHL